MYSSTIQGIPKLRQITTQARKKEGTVDGINPANSLISGFFFFNFRICEAGNFYYLSYPGHGGTLPLQPWDGNVPMPSLCSGYYILDLRSSGI